MVFVEFLIKIHKILGKFMDFQSVLQSLHYMISNVVQGGRGERGGKILHESPILEHFQWTGEGGF